MIPYVLFVTGIYLCGHFPVSGGYSALHGSRLGSFPSPDFTINFTLRAHEGIRSFKQIPHGLNSEPRYIRVFAIARDENRGFSFDGIGSSQNSPSQSAYGGLIYAYDDEYVRIWAPTDRNGHIIYVKDGWGGERNTQVSDEAVVFVEVWKDFPEPTFQLDLEIDTTRGSFQEVDHELRQLPELVVVKVFPIGGKNPNRGFWFPGIAASQNPNPRGGYGGVIFAYNERRVRLWAPYHPQTGCVFIGRGWAGGLYNQHTTKCSVTIQLWVNQLPVPSFKTDWSTFSGQVGQDSFKEITHNLGTLPSLVIVQLKAKYGYNRGYVFQGQGAVQSGDDNSDQYGGVAFAYNNESVRLWAPSRNDGSKHGYPLLVKGKSWGNNTNRQDGRIAVLVRVMVYSGKCNESMETAYVSNRCLDTRYESYIWKTEKTWSDCSSICNSGTQKRALTGCRVTAKRTILWCNFEKPDLCGWLGSYRGLPSGKVSWCRSNTSTPDQQTGPMWGHPRGSYYIYTHSVNAPPDTSAFLTSPLISGGKKCHLHFYWSMHGDEVGTLSVEVKVAKTHPDIDWKDSGWSMTGNQGPVFWRAGFVNLEKFGTIYWLRFKHHLPESDVCKNGTCSRINVAVDSIRLECEVTARQLSTKACHTRAVPFAGCPRSATDYNSKGPAYGSETVGRETYVKASGSKHDIIASYDFQVLYPAEYVVWKETFSTNNATNDISFRVNEGDWYNWRTIKRVAYSVWTQYYLQTFTLKPGKHTVTLRQIEFGFRLRRLMLVPRNISMWTDLGMQSRHIPDSFLTANPDSGSEPAPRFGRLNAAGGAWCSSDRNPIWVYFQVKLPDFALLTRVAIQGDEDEYWITSFEMKVSIDGTKFTSYREMTGPKTFSGNDNADEVKEHELMFAVPVRAVRIFPMVFKFWICMKVELYGFYISRELCSSTGKVPATTKQCTGDRNCGKNAKCQKSVLLNSVHSHKNSSADKQEACQCLSGFHGPSCEHNGCSPTNPCLNNATCHDVQNDFTCTCRPGYRDTFCQHPCPQGYYGKDCSQKCHCSVHGSCDLATGHCNCERGYNGTYCDDRCLPGSYGYDCEQKCQCRNGASCDSVSGSCNCSVGWTGMFCELPCKLNKWGENCNKNCSCTSAAVACDRFTGHCVCRDGFLGKYCELECPHGLYGRNCTYSCQCKNSAICSKADGTCNCTTPGLTGVLCDKPCHAGYFGVNCAHRCNCHSRGACDRVTGDCICPVGWTGATCNSSCPQGYWGRNCTLPCSCTQGAQCNHGRNCSGICNCPRDVVCDHVSSTCRCPAGWQGPMCAQACPAGFYGINCSELCTCQNGASCNHVNGTCTCTPGWAGSNCSEPCHHQRYGMLCAGECYCATNFTEPEQPCDHVTGRCNCRPGYQGPSCLEQCPLDLYGKDCQHNCTCQHGGDCSPSDGTCSCPAGYHGNSCQLPCQPLHYGILCNSTCNCLWQHTTSQNSCDPIDGACSCLRGYTGVLCENTCGEGKFGSGCASQCACQNGAHCDHVHGTCSCLAGYDGRDCSQPCAEGSFGPGCRQKCLCINGAKCDPITGRCQCAPGFLGKLCSVRCLDGRYGVNCSRSCDCHTRNVERCDNGDGACDCSPGFTGRRCDETCSNGFYGKDCRHTCPICSRDRINGTCNHVHGNCSCLPGYEGYLCSDDCSLDRYGVHCRGRCKCARKLCHHVDGVCLDASSGKFQLIFKCSVEEMRNDFARRRKLKRGLEILMNKFFDRFKAEGDTSSSDSPVKLSEAEQNVSFGRETRSRSAHHHDFTVRLLGLEDVELEDKDSGTRGTFVLLDGHTVVDGGLVTAVLERIPREEIGKNIAAKLYTGALYSAPTGHQPGIKAHLPLIIGSSFGFLLVIAIIVIYTATHRRRLAATGRRYNETRKTATEMELQPHSRKAAEPFCLAFQNPYYDVFAAMGLDDDLEEEFYNPLYENASLCSDTTDDSYYECLNDMVIR